VLKAKRAIFEAVTLADVRAVMKRITKDARDGKPWACKLFIEIVVGKPDHKFDPRQGVPTDGEQKRVAYQPTPEEKRVLAQVLLAEADAEEGVIEADGEEVSE
jgi:hypothetical protein